MRIDRAKLHRIYRYWIDWLYPNICPCCGRYIDHDADFCGECKSAITPYTDEKDIEGIDKYTSYCVYDHNIDKAILAFKKTADGNSYYAFACGIAEAARKTGIAEDIDLIVPIPITRKKMKERGYNQTELIAKELRFLLNVPYANVMIKVKDTKEQKTLGRTERAENLSGAFGISDKAPDISGKRLLLIDDVCTTGSTLTEAAGVLRIGGAGKVYAISFAKTPNKKSNEEAAS